MSSARGCILETICPTCYGANYITYGDISKRDPYTCIITKIRALAGYDDRPNAGNTRKILCFKRFSNEELAMTAKGVIQTQSFLEQTGFMEELQNG